MVNYKCYSFNDWISKLTGVSFKLIICLFNSNSNSIQKLY